jgi:hypothetical protein
VPIAAGRGRAPYLGTDTAITTDGVCPDSADAQQLRYAEAIEPGTPKCGLFKMLLHRIASGETAYPTSADLPLPRRQFQSLAGAAEAATFREAARSDLIGAGWRFKE